MCNCNNNCNCENDSCGCKTKASDIVYQGPNLSCTGIETCDDLDVVIQKINALACSGTLVQNIINNINNNIELYEQFITLVNNTLDCETVINCLTTTTTTTICGVCDEWEWLAAGLNGSSLIYVDCDGNPAIILKPDVTDNSGTRCVQQGTVPEWFPAPTTGTHQLSFIGCCAP